MKQICTNCGVEKEITEYHKDKQAKNGYSRRCKECRKIKRRDYNAQEQKYKMEKYYEHKEFCYSLKEPCIICGESEKACIDFHHVDPSTKSFSISGNGYVAKQAVLEELKKCVCLCANCHRKVHADLIDLSAYVETT